MNKMRKILIKIGILPRLSHHAKGMTNFSRLVGTKRKRMDLFGQQNSS